jgi:predicted O-methyltransferase YrrM
MKKAIVYNIVVVLIAILLPSSVFAQAIDTNTTKELFKTHSEDRYALWIELINKISENKKVKIAEIGVWKGAFAAQILKNCPNVEKYYLVDPWRHLSDWKKPSNLSNEKFERIFEDTMKRLEFAKDRISVLRGTTLEVIDQINDSELDLVYIDGDHTAKGIVIDLIKLFPKVKKGGVVGGDDYVDNIYHHNPKRFDPTMVKPVVNGFVAAHNVKHLFWNKNQFAFIKE